MCSIKVGAIRQGGNYRGTGRCRDVQHYQAVSIVTGHIDIASVGESPFEDADWCTQFKSQETGCSQRALLLLPSLILNATIKHSIVVLSVFLLL